MATVEQRREIQEKVSRLVTERFGGDYQKAFDHFDSDHKDGKISPTELRQLLKDSGIGNWLTRDAWVEGIISELDSDGDGMISAAEFNAVIKSLSA